MSDEEDKKPGHTLTDHLYGQDLAHEHDGDADHDHDHSISTPTARSRTTRSGSRTTSR